MESHLSPNGKVKYAGYIDIINIGLDYNKQQETWNMDVTLVLFAVTDTDSLL